MFSYIEAFTTFLYYLLHLGPLLEQKEKSKTVAVKALKLFFKKAIITSVCTKSVCDLNHEEPDKTAIDTIPGSTSS